MGIEFRSAAAASSVTREHCPASTTPRLLLSPSSPAGARIAGCNRDWRVDVTPSRHFRIAAFSAWIASFSRITTCKSWYGCWLSSSRMRLFKRSIWFLVLSRMARWASLSFARFRASCSGVRFATPRDEAEAAVRRRLEVECGVELWSLRTAASPLGESSAPAIDATREMGHESLGGWLSGEQP
jgi:hypothetical protein